MVATKCPNCRAMVPEKELAAGWCESCGKKIPHFVYQEIGMETAEEHRPFNHLHDAPKTAVQVLDGEPFPIVQVGLIAAAVIGIGFVIVRAFI